MAHGVDPRFQALLVRQRRMRARLTAMVAGFHAVVALACAYAPAMLREPVPGTDVSLGIASMLAVIVLGIASAGYYTWWCNTVRDPLAADLLRVRGTGSA